jgi:anti-anti-sigma factor
MERHLMTSVTETGRRTAGPAIGTLAGPTHRPLGRPTRAKTEPQERALSSVNSWTHTLTVTGELTHRSAHALEVEIERLCEEGVTNLTLDLSGLDGIDSVGVAVIAFRCDLCIRRGYGFELIPGTKAIQRAFAKAGVVELLPFRQKETLALELEAITSRTREGCEA